MAKLEDTAAHVAALSILLLNLRKIQYAFLQFLDWLLGFLQPREKLRDVQQTLNYHTNRIFFVNHNRKDESSNAFVPKAVIYFV